jgi:PTH2 family peptidyl-tRNA hydrolase
VSLWLGYQLGARNHGNSGKAGPITDAPAQDEDEDDIADGDLAAVKAGISAPCKLVLVVRTDLRMTPGKIAAQCGHATLACYKALMKKNPKLVHHWERIGQAKIALKADSEEQLMELEAIAKSLNLCARSIQDAGHTQVDPGTKTVLGIGPAPVELVNQVTGKLRLL